MKNPVLVTGGAGYIGSHACKALAAAGYLPITYDDLSRGNAWAVKWGPLVEGRLQDRARLDEVLARYRPGAVLHFAAFAYVGESMEKPALYRENNVDGGESLIAAVKTAGIPRVVYSSSCALYGDPVHLPVDEEHPLKPLSPYGETKLAVEELLRATPEISSVSLRYFNAAGADPEGEVGEAHEPETHLIPLVLQAAAGLRPAIRIYGEDYDTPDGTCLRDYVHVSDLADAHVLALKHLEQGGETTVVNLGAGQAYSVREVIETAERVTGCHIPVESAPRRRGDPAQVYSAQGRAQELLGWRPRHASLEEIITTAWAWMHRRQA